MKKSIVIAGSRSFTDYTGMCTILDKIKWNPGDEIVSGTASGADKLGERYALDHNIKLVKFPADWDKYGKRAGYVRNKEMAQYCTHGVVFWDGKSKGSELMINLLKEYGRKYTVFNFNNQGVIK